MKKVFHFLPLLLIVTAIKAQQPKLMLPIGHTDFVNSAQFSPDGKKVLTTSGDHTAKLWDAFTGKLLTDLKGHTSSVNSACFSPDGKRIITTSSDKTAKIWDAETGTFIAGLKGHTSGIISSSFSRDGKKILTASNDSTAKIWDAFTGKILVNLKGYTGSVIIASFSATGKKILTASNDSTAKIWDAVTGELLIELKGHTDRISRACFSPDGKRIVTASWGGAAIIWDAVTGEVLIELKGHTRWVTSACFSPDGKRIITASSDKTAKIWDAETGEVLIELKGHTDMISCASFSQDGKKVVTTSWDRTANIWEAESGVLIADLKGHTNSVNSACFSPDGKTIVTSSYDGTAKVWDANNGVLLADFKGHTSGINYASYSPDGKKIVTAFNGNTSIIWDAQTGSILTHLEGYTKEAISASYSPNGKKILTVSRDSTIKIWEAEGGILLADLKGHTNSVNSASFSPDGKKVVSSSRDSTVKIWEAESGVLLADLKGHTNSVNSACFSPDGKKIVTSSDDGTAKIWDVMGGKFLIDLIYFEAQDTLKIYTNESGVFVGVVITPYFISSASFSPDGKKIITASWDKTAKIWDAKSGALLVNLKGHTSWVTSACFSPEGKKIVTTSWDRTAKIWDEKTGVLLTTLIGHSSDLKSAFFSPDGKRIISISSDNTAKIWDVEKGDLLYTFFVVDSSDYIIVDKDNHYDGTTGARKLLYFTCGTEVIELDQVKDQLWVPNLAERINNKETINAKTLDELNICGLTPVVEDISIKADEYHFKILPRRGGLGETVLYLNGIEVKRYKPAELKNNGGTYELKIKKVTLKDLFVAGKENRLTVKAFTSDNAISSRALNISEDKSKDKATAPNLFAVMVGVSDYKGYELDLKYPGKDATDISAVVYNAAKNLLNTDGTEHVFMYNLTTDKDHYQLPEKKSIKKVLDEIGIKATANDILLIFFAGHGVMRGTEDNKKFYFLTADASLNSSFGAVADVGISTSELTEWIKPGNIKAQKRIMIFDACNSGQAIKDFVKFGNKDQGYVAARGDEKGQEIKAIEKLNNQSGLFILSASASNRAAYEMGRYSQGLLTYSLLKAIKQQPDILNEGKYLDVSKWFNAARESVSELSKETGSRQDPQIVSNTNFNIGVVDEKVMAKIVLQNEKPLFAACNFQNADENNPVDNLGLNKLIDQQLNSISSRGIDAPIVYAGITSSAEAYTLSGRYNITGNNITIKVFIIQNKEVKQKIDLTGTKDKLDEFTALIATRAAEWASKNK